MTPKESVERRAKELYEIFWNYKSGWEGFSVPPDWFKIANHVEKLLIERAIEELEVVQSVPGKNLYLVDRLVQLQEEKESLNENPKLRN